MLVYEWQTPIGAAPVQRKMVEIRMDQKTLYEKLHEIESLDFYKRVVAYARNRHIHEVFV